VGGTGGRTEGDRRRSHHPSNSGARIGREFPRHEAINHSINEYVRGDVQTNTIEGYFSIMKRGITGVYHHVTRNI
jgi:hypothetical protein